MKLFHAIFSYGPHHSLLPEQCRVVDGVLGFSPVRRVVYVGTDTEVPEGIESFVVGARETYENLPLKTYGLLQHALQDPGWDRLLKTDVNSRLGWFDAATVEGNHLVGYCQWRDPNRRRIARSYHSNRGTERLLAENWAGEEPASWIGGPAYAISRELAQFIIAKGVWAARAWPYEDIMVSAAADEFGAPAVAGIGYFSDQDGFACLHRNRL